MSQVFFYPPSNATSTNPSVGPNGATAPTSSTEIAGVDLAGNLIPVSVDSAGNVNVNVSSSPLPPGSATAANQVLEIAQLDNIDTAVTALNARTPGGLVPLQFDEIALTYIPSGNGTGQIGTAVYKLASVTVKTLTLTYDGSNRLIDVIAS